ncbi:MAG: circularly permuted type 2 ATP-grasp protein [Pirellulales bacterium]
MLVDTRPTATAEIDKEFAERLFSAYRTEGFYDEMFESDGHPHASSSMLAKRLLSYAPDELQRRQKAADLVLLNMGITFNVYGHEAGTEKIWPFDIIPRIIEHKEWLMIESGLKQRIKALNLFIDDLYHDRNIINDGVVPEWLIDSGATLRSPCKGLNPPKRIWCHITGTDLVRGGDGQIYVLEDNLRCPSGVSYVLENREVMKRTFPQVFSGLSILSVEDYPERLRAMLEHIAPDGIREPNVVVMTPGIYNSAYFEHCFLAQQMGVELVQGSDMVVIDDTCYMKTTRGLKRVDVIYRRIDDDFLDPETFRADSALGVPGLMRAYRAGRVSLANAPGTGIADDKAVYAYVPQIIKYYLNEEMILPNVPTHICGEPDQCAHVIDNIQDMVIKPTNESGGYGILLGPKATAAEHARYKELIKANPRNYVAQPMLALSRVPTIVNDHLEGRHVDLRPYILYGEEIYVLPGGLTRVALKKGSLVVNSSQGGGSKDTWVVKQYGS